MAGELDLRVTPARPVIPSLATDQLVYALVELRPTESATVVTMPLNLSLVLDRSGSMQGKKIEALRAATQEVLDLLGPQDTFSVIAFNNRMRVLVPAQPVSPERKTALQAEIRRMDADGGTNMAPAMEAGIVELRKQMPTEGGGNGQVNRLVLLTDGITEREKRCLRQAEAAAGLGIPIVALGIGRDWNDKLMQAIADRTGGTADYVQDPDEIGRYFQRTVQQMQAVALQRAGLRVRVVAGVTLRTVFRVFPLIGRLGGAQAGERVVETALGEIERGGGQTLLLELIVPPRPPGSYRVAQVEIGYEVPGSGQTTQTAATEVLLRYTSDASQVSPPDPRVMNLVEKVTAFKLQTRALEDLDAGNIEGATGKLQSAVTHLLSQGDLDLANTVQHEIENLQKARAMSPEGRKTIRFSSGKTVRLDR
jgi:Ca-activated chloride channel family protein